MNKYSSNMNVDDILGYLMSKMKVKHKRSMLELDLLFNSMSDFFAELNNSFKYWKTIILGYSWCNGYRHDTLVILIY